MEAATRMETRKISSLVKVFADEELQAPVHGRGSALRGEMYSFQVAYRASLLIRPLHVFAESALQAPISVRSVELVPSNLACYHDADDHALRRTPGLYPDLLMLLNPLKGITGYPNQWRSVWVTVELPPETKPGTYDIDIVFELEMGEEVGRETFVLEVIAATLPEQTLKHTEWFHTDCIATYYKTDIFSEEHWRRIGQFIETAVKHGMNMILTPLFTPPLDTAVGGSRPTVQLVDVEMSEGTYRFRFDRLQRWIDLCDRLGMTYFEFSHLFTQWGAKHAPKIMATVDGKEEQLFGWHTDSADPEYTRFISLFLTELVRFVEENGIQQRVYFHLSDEPKLEDMDTYRAAFELIQPYLRDYPIVDALSDLEFYKSGLIRNPIPASYDMQPFLDHGVEDLWTYYCCAQYKQVSNRFFNMPSSRNRVLGMQIYKLQLAGFLHWGYNFWYAQFSEYPIDPFTVTDAGGGFPSGDAYLVYPGPDGPIESIRLEVLTEALQDLRALQLLETKIGRERVVSLLEEGLGNEITLNTYPQETEWYICKREEINQQIQIHS